MPSGFINYPFTTNPSVLLKGIYDYIQSKQPLWEPNDANLETWIAQIMATQAADIQDMASNVPMIIFRWFGRSMVGIPQETGSSATVATTWTMIDNLGHTVPSGTQVAIRDSLGVMVPFVTIADFSVYPGSTATAAGAVTLTAVTSGLAGTGLGGASVAATLIDTLAYVSSIVMAAATSGGVDAEDDLAYITRLSGRLRMLSTRPILPGDFASLAGQVAGVYRSVAIDGYDPNKNELQSIVVDATGGTFTLTYSGQTTAAIAYNASAATVKAGLEALSNIDVGDVSCSGGVLATSPVVVEFKGQFAGANVAAMTSNSASLTGATHTATVSTTRQGAALTGNERTIAVCSLDSTGADVSAPIKALVLSLLLANREQNWVINVIPATKTAIDVAYTIKVLSGYTAVIVKTAVDAAIADFLNPAKWGRDPSYTGQGSETTWIESTTVRYFSVAKVIEAIEGVDAITSGNLTICVAGGTPGVADVAIPGPAALAITGTITGSTA